MILAATAGVTISLSASSYVAARSAGIVGQQFDLSGNQVVNAADLSVAADSWMAEPGSPRLGPGDIDHSGHVDIADIQLIAAQIGQATTLLAQGALNQGAPLAQVAEKVFVVNSAAAGSPADKNFGDSSPGDGVCATSSGACTLQAALQETNAPRNPAYRARVTFDIRGDGGVCPDIVRIMPNLDYQRWLQIDNSSGMGTVVDGYTQCGAQPNSNAIAGNAVVKIEIVGTKLGAGGASYPARNGVNGLEIKSPNNLVRGLSLYNWDRQIEISAPGTFYNQLQGNFLGTDASNTFLRTATGAHHGEGLRLQYGASYTVLGCGAFSNGAFVACADPAAAYAARNIVAGNGNDGIHIERQDSYQNRIVGNYIGIAQDGRIRRAGDGSSLSKNYADGVDFEAGANNNWLGGESVLERNIVSGNSSEGIEISHSTLTQNNRVVGNYFGLDAYGDVAANGGNGISFGTRSTTTSSTATTWAAIIRAASDPTSWPTTTRSTRTTSASAPTARRGPTRATASTSWAAASTPPSTTM